MIDEKIAEQNIKLAEQEKGIIAGEAAKTEQDEVKKLTTRFEQEIQERDARIEAQTVTLAEQEGRIAKQEEMLVDHEQKMKEKLEEQERMISKYCTY